MRGQFHGDTTTINGFGHPNREQRFLGGVFKIRGHRLKTEHRCAYSLGYRIS